MAKKVQTGPAEFKLSIDWPKQAAGGGDPLLDASVGRLGIAVGDHQAASFKSDKGDTGTEVTVPLYDFAEWIAENWWALLYEPRKSEQSEDDFGFRSRHWLGTARNGFALPDMWITPAGDTIEISARDCYLRSSRVQFLEKFSSTATLENVRAELEEAVTQIIYHLNEAGFVDTAAQNAWRLIAETKADEEFYCRLVGSLGLSPYERNDALDELINFIANAIDDEIFLIDLCQASDLTNLERLSRIASSVRQALPSSQSFSLDALSSVRMPTDSAPFAWKWGLDATKQVRQNLGISERDPHGGNAFFELIGLDPELDSAVCVTEEGNDAGHLAGGVFRQDTTLQLALVDAPPPQRRFSAARGAFLGWLSKSNTSRLVTGARTRDQQASRAFAAEMLAPISYIRGRARGSTVSLSRIGEIADELDVSAAVVQHQAENNGYFVARY
jgi:hypothetical protein